VSWLTLVNLLLKVVGGILNYLHETRLIKAGADAEQLKELLVVSQNVVRARRAVDRARVDANKLRNKYRRK
jgi:hypothetical protein